MKRAIHLRAVFGPEVHPGVRERWAGKVAACGVHPGDDRLTNRLEEATCGSCARCYFGARQHDGLRKQDEAELLDGRAAR